RPDRLSAVYILVEKRCRKHGDDESDADEICPEPVGIKGQRHTGETQQRFDAGDESRTRRACEDMRGDTAMCDAPAHFSAQAARKPSRRLRMISSASETRRSISSLQVGMSWMRPATMPQLQAPASISPPCMTRG